MRDLLEKGGYFLHEKKQVTKLVQEVQDTFNAHSVRLVDEKVQKVALQLQTALEYRQQ